MAPDSNTRRRPTASDPTGSDKNNVSRDPVYAADQLFGKHGVPVSSLIMALPAPIRALSIYLYVDILRPEDDFITQLRKLVITFAALLSMASSSVGVYNNITLDDINAATVFARVVPCMFLIVFTLVYLSIRFDILTTEMAANVWMFVSEALALLLVISTADWPTNESLIILAILALLFRTRLMPLQLALFVIIMCVFDVNSASFSRGQPEITPWALPGLVMRGVATRLLLNFVSLCSLLCTLAAVQLQLTESDRQSKTAQKSVDLARAVSRCLAKYDTLRARAALDEASVLREGDKELISHLHQLLDNLDKYRPHLPNWLLPDLSDEDVDLTDSDTKSHSQTRFPPAAEVGPSETSYTKMSSSQQSRKSDERHGASGMSDIDNLIRRNEWLALGTAVQHGIAVAHVAFNEFATHVTPATVNEWVVWVHREAGHTAAAVHTFVGDMVQLSWNAASRAVQSEAKAARFLARAARHGREHGLRLHGAAMSGKARIQLAGGERVQALTISGAWMRGLEEMRKIAHRLGAMVVDQRTREGSHFAVHYRAAAVMEMMMCDHDNEPQQRVEHDEATAVGTAFAGDNGTGLQNVRKIEVFEVMRELQDDEGGEWMYVLQGREVTSTSSQERLGSSNN